LKALRLEDTVTMRALHLLPAYSAYKKTYTLLRQSRGWSREELAAYQAEVLSRLLDHAYENVPYYRRVFDDRGLVPADIRTPGDLTLLPFLTKEIVQANIADLKARNYPEAASRACKTARSFWRSSRVRIGRRARSPGETSRRTLPT